MILYAKVKDRSPDICWANLCCNFINDIPLLAPSSKILSCGREPE